MYAFHEREHAFCLKRRRSSLAGLLGSAEALTIESGTVKAAHAFLPGSEHFAGIVDPTPASLQLLGGGNPLYPVSARNGRDFRPQRPSLWCVRESLAQIRRNTCFRLFCNWHDLQQDYLAYLCF